MKLLILSASTGGGHDMRAFALRDWCRELGWQAQVHHPMEDGSPLYGLGIELYNLIQRKALRLHDIYFPFLEFAKLHRNPRLLIGKRKFENLLLSLIPDVIISFHAHLNHAYLEISKKIVPQSKFIIYAGELADGRGFSRHWANPRADLFTGPFASTCRAAIRRGMPSSKCKASGLLLRKPFHLIPSKEVELRTLESLGINPRENFVLLGTGANGVNNHHAICREILQPRNRFKFTQVVALCGNNETTKLKLENLENQSPTKLITIAKVEALEMSILLRNALWLLCRPGAGLAAEALATGAPVIFNLCGGVMPQESNNLNYWRHQRGGFHAIRKAREAKKIFRQAICSIHQKADPKPQILDLIRRIAE